MEKAREILASAYHLSEQVNLYGVDRGPDIETERAEAIRRLGNDMGYRLSGLLKQDKLALQTAYRRDMESAYRVSCYVLSREDMIELRKALEE